MTKALHPTLSGDVERDGSRLRYYVFGEGGPTTLFAPAFPIADASNTYLGQIPFFSRRQRCVIYDAPGTGGSTMAEAPERMGAREWVSDLFAVADAVGAEQFVAAGLSLGGLVSLLAAASAPERVQGAVAIAPAISWDDDVERAPYVASFEEQRDTYAGWERWNAHSIATDYRGFLDFFMSQGLGGSHRDADRAWFIEKSLATSQPEAPIAFIRTTLGGVDPALMEAVLSAIQCPVILLTGDDDNVIPDRFSRRTASVLGVDPVIIEGGGHDIAGFNAPIVNRIIDDWLDQFRASTSDPVPTPKRSTKRVERVLYLSSPIGLGHVRRDVAIADEMRKLAPQAEIEWLTQQPATDVLEHRKEVVHPASSLLLSENSHIAEHAGDHGIDAARAWLTMADIFAANYSVFSDVLAEGDYDLVIADEAWDVDGAWLDNPAAKTTRYAWLTDFVGEIALPELGAESASHTLARNARMIHSIETNPHVRDLSLFIGDPDDVVNDTFGEGLGEIRPWVEQHFDFTGYITGFDPDKLAPRDQLRDEYGIAADETIVVVAVGGSGIGAALLHSAAGAHGILRSRRNNLRTVLVAGPNIDPATLSSVPGLDVRGWVPALHNLLSVSDAAVVQGGLTTTMELTATGVPFLYAPLEGHFEQQRHVHHRLQRFGAGDRIDHSIDPDDLAERLDRLIGQQTNYLAVPTNGAALAAQRLVELL